MVLYRKIFDRCIMTCFSRFTSPISRYKIGGWALGPGRLIAPHERERKRARNELPTAGPPPTVRDSRMSLCTEAELTAEFQRKGQRAQRRKAHVVLVRPQQTNLKHVRGAAPTLAADGWRCLLPGLTNFAVRGATGFQLCQQHLKSLRIKPRSDVDSS